MGGGEGEVRGRETEREIERLQGIMEAGKSQGQEKTGVPAQAIRQEGKRGRSLLLPPLVPSGP